MSAEGLQIITIDIPNPEWSPNRQGQAQTVSPALSYSYDLAGYMQTLSTSGSNADPYNVVGLMYVPDLNATDPCRNASAPYVPNNVTRLANLPDASSGATYIALAPWISPQCTLNYLASAETDPLIRGFLFFQSTDNDTSQPPPPTDPSWQLGDNGAWKQKYNYPVYAVPGALGLGWLKEMSLYSGNMTDVPYGHQLTQMYDPRDYVRLYVEIVLSGGSSLPSLWVFLLIVLGILIAVIGLTSFTMHWLQRRRRQTLRRRVANGEVDLEALGIKRLTVPQELLDEMPLYVYGTGAPVAPAPTKEASTTTEVVGDESTATPAQPRAALLRHSSYRPTPLSQPTCAICLDDFVPASGDEPGTTVRELPCHHIFHPECVDAFLRDSSSLCPMCKKTALPKGYCPRVITNAMVRRERIVRRIQARIAHDPSSDRTGDAPHDIEAGERRRRPLGSRFPSFSTRGYTRPDRFGTPSSPRASAPVEDVALTPRVAAPTSSTSSGDAAARTSTAPPPASSANRREWARQRAVSMLGRRAPVDPDAEEAQNTPAWRKAMRSVFPAVR